MSNTSDLLAIIQDKDHACVDRGEAIDMLVQSGMNQVAIADSTGLSKETISHLKTCFRDLAGVAREMCKAGRMNVDACYSLASATLDQGRIIRRAIELGKDKDTRRSVQKSSKGRQTRPGQITNTDIKEAIEWLKTCAQGRAGMTSRDFERPSPPRPNTALSGNDVKLSAAPGVFVDKPNRQTVAFNGKFVNLSAIGRATGIDLSYLSRIFRGERMPTLPYIKKISAALGLQIQEFIEALDRHLKP